MRAVLTFHRIDDGPGPLSYRPQRFRALLETLADGDIPVVDLPTLLNPGTTRGLALTFDDGYRSVHDVALPMLRQHAFPAHLFLATGWLEGETPPQPRRAEGLTWDMVARLHESGVAIESHTRGHPDLRTLSDSAIDAECSSADESIERRVGRRPRYFAYPFGYHDRRVAARIGARYAAAFTTQMRMLSVDDAAPRLPRLDAHYLRSPLVVRDLAGPLARGYIVLCRLLRILRGSE
jgi:peptidoglycan/xylan/chitin deacetylase (PgdA/CDA1 family)